MPAPKLLVTQVTARVVPVYFCVNCGVSAQGDRSFEATGLSIAILGELRRWSTPTSIYIPVGWASYGLDEHRCPRCII